MKQIMQRQTENKNRQLEQRSNEIDLENKLVQDFMSKKNYDAINRIKDLEKRDKRRTAIADKFAESVVPVRKAKEIEMIQQTLVNMQKKS